MSDIVERLRNSGDKQEGPPSFVLEAADEISRLRKMTKEQGLEIAITRERDEQLDREVSRLRSINVDILAALEEIEKISNAFQLPPIIRAERCTKIIRAAIAKARGDQFGRSRWFSLPLPLRQRWWKETDYGKSPPSEELAREISGAVQPQPNN